MIKLSIEGLDQINDIDLIFDLMKVINNQLNIEPMIMVSNYIFINYDNLEELKKVLIKEGYSIETIKGESNESNLFLLKKNPCSRSR